MSDDGPDLDAIEAQAHGLLERMKSLMLATTSSEGIAQASYAPFVRHGDALHVFVSDLARHTRNLLEQARVDVMVIDDESATRQPFARLRLTLECTVEEIPRDHDHAVTLLERFDERFGEVMGLLQSLPDFHLLRLVPRRGTFVRGFGQAYTFDGPAIAGFEHVDEQRVRRRGP